MLWMFYAQSLAIFAVFTRVNFLCNAQLFIAIFCDYKLSLKVRVICYDLTFKSVWISLQEVVILISEGNLFLFLRNLQLPEAAF